MESLLAGLLGRLLGTMVDFITWGPAAIAVFAFTKKAWVLRLSGAIVFNIGLGILFVIGQGGRYGPIDMSLFAWGFVATLVWFAIFMSLRSSIRRSK